MKDFFKTVSESVGDELISGVAIALCFIMIFSVGFYSGTFTKAPVEQAVAPVTESTTESTTASTTPTAETTTAPSDLESSDTTASSQDDSTTSAEPPSGEKSIAEIVALYNESANKVKTNATKVIRNFEDREVQQDKLEAPGVLQPMASSLIPKFMGDEMDPVEYATKEEIKEKFMVPNQDYVSKMTEADVEEATCTDNGTEYEIMIKMKETVDPSAGVGVGSAFDVIEASEVSESVDFVEKFSTTYYDCVLKCKIDKATGNMTWANYKTPLVLDVTVNLMGTHDAKVGLSFEKDYTIVY